MASVELNDDDVARFEADGFVVAEDILSAEDVASIKNRFAPLFRGEFETGLQPDEWNWREGRDAEDLTRQICNAWKSDRTIAAAVLRADIGRACARLAGWPGARLAQDNVLWKPPGGRALGFHQDESYTDWVEPGEMTTCWIALDDTAAEGGTIEYARGSHRWRRAGPIAQFHAPDDPLTEVTEAAATEGKELELVPLVVPAGSGAFHHGRTWHGSQAERRDMTRRSLVVHCFSSDARFCAGEVGPIYGRYKRAGDLTMDETFFPIIWTMEGHRSGFIDAYLERGWSAT